MSLFPELVLLLVNGGNKLMSFYHHVLSYGEIIRKAICSVCYGCLLLSYAFKLDFGERIKNIQVRNLPLLSFFFARFFVFSPMNETMLYISCSVMKFVMWVRWRVKLDWAIHIFEQAWHHEWNSACGLRVVDTQHKLLGNVPPDLFRFRVLEFLR